MRWRFRIAEQTAFASWRLSNWVCYGGGALTSALVLLRVDCGDVIIVYALPTTLWCANMLIISDWTDLVLQKFGATPPGRKPWRSAVNSTILWTTKNNFFGWNVHHQAEWTLPRFWGLSESPNFRTQLDFLPSVCSTKWWFGEFLQDVILVVSMATNLIHFSVICKPTLLYVDFR